MLEIIAENSEYFRLVVCPNNKRDSDTLISIIKEHVAPGSIICTDEWRAYHQASIHGYQHRTVNHSVEFIVIA